MCSMGVSSSSCGSLETIAHMGVPNITVFATRRDERTSTTGPCMHVEIAFNGFLLQNAFIRVKICFIGHIIVCPVICRSFDIFSFFFFLITQQQHLNTEVSLLVQYSLINSLPNDRILVCTKLKALADDRISMTFENTFVVWKDRKLRLVKRRIYNINIYHGKELKGKTHGSGWYTFKSLLDKHIYFILMLR